MLCSDVDTAITTFRQLQLCDPFRLDNLDTYSNLLYVKELRVELAHLAHLACEIDKYRVETCCVVGELIVQCNLYSVMQDLRVESALFKHQASERGN